MPRPVAAAATAQSSLEGLLDAFSQNLRGDEIHAILTANPHTFHISGTVKGDKATLLGEIGWRDGRTLPYPPRSATLTCSCPARCPPTFATWTITCCSTTGTGACEAGVPAGLIIEAHAR